MGAAQLALPVTTVTAESVSASKPDPEGFLRGAELLGVDPADCVVFEDSGAGIRAGLAAGMRVIGVGRHAAAHAPTVQVDDLTQVAITPTDDGFEITIR
jgi:sugar-phosphatase